jgi:hypothetical protein
MHPMTVEQFAQARRHVESGRRACERTDPDDLSQGHRNGQKSDGLCK